MKTRLLGLLAAIMLVGILFQASSPAQAWHPKPAPGNPMIFVHGGSGVGAQFESQAQRFESNGYPADYVDVVEYDSSSIGTIMPQVLDEIDQHIADLLAETGADQVDLLGHSLGTTVSAAYLNSSPARAAKVAHYVNIDGQTGPIPVPTLALWAGRGTPGREIVGATNVTIPDVTHVQCATSADSFVEMYKFFTGKDPASKDIIPEFPLFIKLSGRALFFPTNSGVPDGTVQVWAVNGRTGQRLTRRPAATYPMGGDGSWGPFTAIGGLHYEFAIVREGQWTHHFYYEPFLRSDHLIRLQTEPPGTGLGEFTDESDHQTDLIVLRNKEFWGNVAGENDVLELNGVNVVNATTCPFSALINAIFAFDRNTDGISDVSQNLYPFYLLHFLLGVDLYIPGTTPPNATVPAVLTPRGGGDTQVINVPNWASLTDRVTLQFHDYSQDNNSWLEYVLSLLRR